MFPLRFQSIHTLPLPTAIEGWSILPTPATTGVLKVAPPSVLNITLILFTAALMYTRKRFPNVSKAAWASQQAAPVATVPRVQLTPPLNEYARNMLFDVRVENDPILFGLVGLTTTN